MARRWLIGVLAAASLGFLASGLTAQQPDRVDVLILFRNAPGQADADAVRGAGGRIKYTYRIVPAMAASLPAPAVNALQNNGRVALVEPDGVATANDAELDNTWGVNRIGAGLAHTSDPPVLGAGVNVAVIDTGIDYTHPDLFPNYRGGYDFVNGDNDPMDDNGHGTHVSGTIAARKDGVGVVGMAPEANLWGLKVLGANGSGSYSNIIAAVDWASSHGISVTNNSYSGTGTSATMELAFANAAAAGVVSVAAASNSGTCAGTGDNVGYPAKYASVIAVAAINSADARACFSSTGPDVELSAPGVSINSTIRGGGYASNWSGTSMASPHVAGLAVLLISHGLADVNGNGRVNDEVRNVMAMSAQDLGAAGRDPLYGFGRVDVGAAFAVTPTPTLHVASISYSGASAGRGNSNKDLLVTVSAVYGLVVPQPGATIAVTVTVNGNSPRNFSGVTDASGNVSFTIKSATSGTYTTVVTSASASGLAWDSTTPANSFVK